jgi:hypothetical protein
MNPLLLVLGLVGGGMLLAKAVKAGGPTKYRSVIKLSRALTAAEQGEIRHASYIEFRLLDPQTVQVITDYPTSEQEANALRAESPALQEKLNLGFQITTFNEPVNGKYRLVVRFSRALTPTEQEQTGRTSYFEAKFLDPRNVQIVTDHLISEKEVTALKKMATNFQKSNPMSIEISPLNERV